MRRTGDLQRRLAGVVGLAAVVLLLTGCQALAPRHAMAEAVPTDSSAALMEYIADEPYVTAEPGYRAAYALWRGESFDGDYAALTDVLRDGKIIGRSWDLPADKVLTRGSVGYLICRACDIGGGVNWRLTGLERYAWRELIYLGIAEPSSEYGYVAGGQFVGMLTRAEEHVAGRSGWRKVELGSPPGE